MFYDQFIAEIVILADRNICFQQNTIANLQ